MGKQAVKAVPWASLYVWFWQAPRLMTVVVGGLENPVILLENRRRQAHKLPTGDIHAGGFFPGRQS